MLFFQDPLTVAMAEIKESGALTLATQPTQTPTPQVAFQIHQHRFCFSF